MRSRSRIRQFHWMAALALLGTSAGALSTESAFGFRGPSSTTLQLLAATGPRLPRSTSGPTQDFCSDPFNAICSLTTENPIVRMIRLEEIKRRLRDAALAVAAAAIGRDPVRFTLTELHALPPVSSILAQSAYQSQLDRGIDEEVGRAELAAIEGNVQRLRGYLEQAIDAHFPANHLLNRTMKSEIAAVEIVYVRTLATQMRESHPDAPVLLRGFAEGCGMDGLADNAFATTTRWPDGTVNRYLMICPGTLLSAGKPVQGLDAGFNNVLQTLAHELGHHVDAQRFPAVYGFYSRCLRGHYADVLGDRALRPGSLATPLEIFSPLDARVNNHLNEIVADYWAAWTTHFYLQAEALHLTAAGRLDALRQIYGSLCGSVDEGIHPTGDFRLETILRTNRGIRGQLGCDSRSATSRPACDLRGVLTVLSELEL